jgi:hypothetical protein
MLEGVPPAIAGAVNTIRSAQKPQTAATFHLSRPVGGIPPAPPADALAALDRAARVAAQLKERGLGVHFDVADGGKVTAQVVDAGGAVVRQIPVASALDLLSGDGPSIVDTLDGA